MESGKDVYRFARENIKEILLDNDIIGADICGERNPYEPIPEFIEDRAINKKTNKLLYDILTKVIG